MKKINNDYTTNEIQIFCYRDKKLDNPLKLRKLVYKYIRCQSCPATVCLVKPGSNEAIMINGANKTPESKILYAPIRDTIRIDIKIYAIINMRGFFMIIIRLFASNL